MIITDTARKSFPESNELEKKRGKHALPDKGQRQSEQAAIHKRRITERNPGRTMYGIIWWQQDML